MDPIALATITSGVVVLANEVFKKVASEAGKDLWDQVKSLFGWSDDPEPEVIAVEIAERLNADPELAKSVLGLLQSRPVGSAASLVGSIDAKKVVVIKDQTVSRDFKIRM